MHRRRHRSLTRHSPCKSGSAFSMANTSQGPPKPSQSHHRGRPSADVLSALDATATAMMVTTSAIRSLRSIEAAAPSVQRRRRRRSPKIRNRLQIQSLARSSPAADIWKPHARAEPPPCRRNRSNSATLSCLICPTLTAGGSATKTKNHHSLTFQLEEFQCLPALTHTHKVHSTATSSTTKGHHNQPSPCLLHIMF